MKPRSRIPIGLVALTLASIVLALLVFWSFRGEVPGAATKPRMGPSAAEGNFSQDSSSGNRLLSPSTFIQTSDDDGNRRFETTEGAGIVLSPAIFTVFILSLLTTYWVGRQSGSIRRARPGAGYGQLLDPSFLRARASLEASLPRMEQGAAEGSSTRSYPSESRPETDPDRRQSSSVEEEPAPDNDQGAEDQSEAEGRPEEQKEVGGDKSLYIASQQTCNNLRSQTEVCDDPDEQPWLRRPSAALGPIRGNDRAEPARDRPQLPTASPVPGLSLEPCVVYFGRTSLRVATDCPVGPSMRYVIGAMKQVAHSSRQIGQLVKIMDDFVFQANLLALEAAVEAGRISQGGRGLTAVASRSRQLAVCSAETARNTADLVARIQTEILSGSELVQAVAENFISPAPGDETAESASGPAPELADHR